jgi:hypothetical protein
MLLENHPDVVVIATGATWEKRLAVVGECDHVDEKRQDCRIWGLDEALRCVAAHATHRLGKRILIWDATGTYAPLGLADVLTSQGLTVVVATPNEALGQWVTEELDAPYVRATLEQRKVAILVSQRLERLTGRAVILRNAWGGRATTIRNVDCVVTAVSRRPNDELSQAFEGSPRKVYCIGDALAPRSVEAIIHEAESLARTI